MFWSLLGHQLETQAYKNHQSEILCLLHSFFVLQTTDASCEMRIKTTPIHTVAKAHSIARQSTAVRAVHSLNSSAEARMTVDVNVT